MGGLPQTIDDLWAFARACQAGGADRTAPCRFIGPPTGDTVTCPTCAGRVELKVLKCAVFGGCTPTVAVDGTACCVGCNEYQPGAPPAEEVVPVAAPRVALPDPTGGSAGIVLGHYGLPGLARLNVEAIRAHAGGVPVLIADDGSGRDAAFDRVAGDYPSITFWPSAERLGHYAGDLSVFWKGLQWAHHQGVRWLCKLSQRFVWDRPGWLAAAIGTLRDSGHATLMSPCLDNGVNLFVRSECMILDVGRWLPHLAEFSARRLDQPTELRIWHLIHTHFGGAYAGWPGLSPNRYAKTAGAVWHGSDSAPVYSDLAARYGVTLDPEFGVAGWDRQPNWKRG